MGAYGARGALMPLEAAEAGLEAGIRGGVRGLGMLGRQAGRFRSPIPTAVPTPAPSPFQGEVDALRRMGERGRAMPQFPPLVPEPPMDLTDGFPYRHADHAHWPKQAGPVVQLGCPSTSASPTT